MEYVYKVLVIDDEVQIKAACNSYRKYLNQSNIDIQFDIINNEANYNEKEPYDILMVDYDLKKGYSDKIMGDKFIKKFRQKNRISKVIFYSSSFEFDEDNKKYKFPFSPKQCFELINIMQIDRIAYRNNFNMMVDVIKSCCEQLDILPIVLSRVLDDYKKEDIGVSYTNLKGEEINATVLVEDIMNDTLEGKYFREKLTNTVLSVLLNYKY